jgi:hypothetical protein
MQRNRLETRLTGPTRRKLTVAHAALLPLFWAPGSAFAQVSETLNGPPVQVTPYLPEPGVPTITIPQGTPTPITSGTGDGSGTGGDDTSGGDPMDTMLAQSWGSTAIADAQALGLNPSALAATCVIESGCGANVGDGSGAQGVFQMYPDAFQEGLQTALAADPSLSSEIVQGTAGMDDPTTEAIAASGYLMQANQTLENAGISNPTVIDARGYYNFGPTYAVPLAQAPTSEPIANVLYGMTESDLKANGISPGETVGQWQDSVASKIGNSADQSISS